MAGTVIHPTPVVDVTILDGAIILDGAPVPSEVGVTPYQTAIHTIARQVARPLGRPVRAIATDDSGRTRLVVHPDGTATHVEPIQDDVPSFAPDGQQRASRAPQVSGDATSAGGATTDEPDLEALYAGSLAPEPAPVARLVPRATAPEPQTPTTTSSRAPAAVASTPRTAHLDRPDHVAQVDPPSPRRSPTLADLLDARPPAPIGPAQRGWQGVLRRVTGGLIKPAPGPVELRHRDAVESVQRSLDGPKTIVVVNPKGGGTKTTASILMASTFGIHRGGYTLAWDNNETRGTLGWRAEPARHTNTAVDLLRDLDRFADVSRARVGDLDNYVRAQGSAQFDVLASDEDAASAAAIDAHAFNDLHATLSRFYRVLVVDTGNNMRASNWQAALEAADQLVIVSTVREDTAQSAAWLVDALRAAGFNNKVDQAVTVLTSPARTTDKALSTRLEDHFGQLTRTVLHVPHDAALVPGGPITYAALSPATREAWLHVSAAAADGL